MKVRARLAAGVSSLVLVVGGITVPAANADSESTECVVDSSTISQCFPDPNPR